MKITVVIIIVSLALGLFAFISSGNWILAAIMTTVFSVYGLLHVHRKINRHFAFVQSAHECQRFINTILLSMSVRNSLNEAFENATVFADGRLKEEIAHIEGLSTRAKIDYLNKYFHFDIYYMFLNILTLFEEQGGSILSMSESLIKEVHRLEETLITFSSMVRHKIVEFIVLWLITLSIIVFMHFGLATFYKQMLNGYIVIIMTSILYLLLLISLHLAIAKFTNFSFIEGNHHETI